MEIGDSCKGIKYNVKKAVAHKIKKKNKSPAFTYRKKQKGNWFDEG